MFYLLNTDMQIVLVSNGTSKPCYQGSNWYVLHVDVTKRPTK